MTGTRKFQYAVILALIAAYTGLRFWRLADSCLWFDEIFSVHAAEHPWSGLWSFIALDLIHPPLFYVLLKLWIAVGGESVFWLRSLPVLFSIIAIFPFLALCRELKLNLWTQALALFLIAVNGSLIKYAQEVRMYSLLMCLGLFSMWLFARYFFKQKGLAALVIVNIILVWTHYFGWLVILSELVAILIFQRAKLRPIAIMCAVVLAGFLPWVVTVLRPAQLGSALGQNIGWMSRPGFREIGVFVIDMIEPIYCQNLSSEPASIYLISIPLLTIVAASFLVYFVRRADLGVPDDRASFLLAIFFAVPVAVAFIASWMLPHSIWGTRHLITVFAPFAILIAASIVAIREASLRAAMASAVILLSGYAFVSHNQRNVVEPPWCGFEKLSETIRTDGPAYVFEDLAAYHLWFTFRKDTDPRMRPRVVKLEGFPGMVEDKAYFLPRGFDDEFVRREPMRYTSERMLIVYRASSFDEATPPLKAFVANGFAVQRREIYDAGGTQLIAVLIARGQ